MSECKTYSNQNMSHYRAGTSWAHALGDNCVMWLVVYESDATEEAEDFREDLSKSGYSHSVLAGDTVAKQLYFIGYWFPNYFHFLQS